MPVESPGESAVRRFYRWRALTRILFLLGCALVLIPAAGARAAPEVMSPAVRDAVAMVGLLMLLAVFPLYWYAVNRCPLCRRSFSQAPEYADDETPGVPLFQSVARCPFCDVTLDKREPGPH